MEPKEILTEAADIARNAQRDAERADLEQTVREFESSTVPALRSLARAYRMLQHPFG